MLKLCQLTFWATLTQAIPSLNSSNQPVYREPRDVGFEICRNPSFQYRFSLKPNPFTFRPTGAGDEELPEPEAPAETEAAAEEVAPVTLTEEETPGGGHGGRFLSTFSGDKMGKRAFNSCMK